MKKLQFITQLTTAMVCFDGSEQNINPANISLGLVLQPWKWSQTIFLLLLKASHLSMDNHWYILLQADMAMSQRDLKGLNEVN